MHTPSALLTPIRQGGQLGQLGMVGWWHSGLRRGDPETLRVRGFGPSGGGMTSRQSTPRTVQGRTHSIQPRLLSHTWASHKDASALLLCLCHQADNKAPKRCMAKYSNMYAEKNTGKNTSKRLPRRATMSTQVHTQPVAKNTMLAGHTYRLAGSKDGINRPPPHTTPCGTTAWVTQCEGVLAAHPTIRPHVICTLMAKPQLCCVRHETRLQPATKHDSIPGQNDFKASATMAKQNLSNCPTYQPKTPSTPWSWTTEFLTS